VASWLFSSRQSMSRAANNMACAQLRLNLAMPLVGMDRDTESRGGFGGRSRDGFGMMGVCPWQYSCCSPQ
jgi:hypothetical protein